MTSWPCGFGIEFDIVTRDPVEASQIGNPFAERNLLIARLDHLARNDDLRERLRLGDLSANIAGSS